mmetsp:Transcript_16249/g.50448  ORF Transcript_16249/g.50448 Transcript_16249/m.50448 type:complete len:206 (-) Transcript_16249:355-972(-)
MTSGRRSVSAFPATAPAPRRRAIIPRACRSRRRSAQHLVWMRYSMVGGPRAATARHPLARAAQSCPAPRPGGATTSSSSSSTTRRGEGRARARAARHSRAARRACRRRGARPPRARGCARRVRRSSSAPSLSAGAARRRWRQQRAGSRATRRVTRAWRGRTRWRIRAWIRGSKSLPAPTRARTRVMTMTSGACLIARSPRTVRAT